MSEFGAIVPPVATEDGSSVVFKIEMLGHAKEFFDITENPGYGSMKSMGAHSLEVVSVAKTVIDSREQLVHLFHAIDVREQIGWLSTAQCWVGIVHPAIGLQAEHGDGVGIDEPDAQREVNGIWVGVGHERELFSLFKH